DRLRPPGARRVPRLPPPPALARRRRPARGREPPDAGSATGGGRAAGRGQPHLVHVAGAGTGHPALPPGDGRPGPDAAPVHGRARLPAAALRPRRDAGRRGLPRGAGPPATADGRPGLLPRLRDHLELVDRRLEPGLRTPLPRGGRAPGGRPEPALGGVHRSRRPHAPRRLGRRQPAVPHPVPRRGRPPAGRPRGPRPGQPAAGGQPRLPRGMGQPRRRPVQLDRTALRAPRRGHAGARAPPGHARGRTRPAAGGLHRSRRHGRRRQADPAGRL
ncbi:MAG: Putative DNA-binding protein, partial [uncultured Blastococcus sp.]